MDRKVSNGTLKCRGSAVSSIASSISSISSLAPTNPTVKIFSPDGTDFSCTVTTKYNDVYVTIREKGKRDITRSLRLCYGYGEDDNKDQMGKWHCSMINATDKDPTGMRTSAYNSTQERIDPGHLPYIYQNHLNCLEVMIGPDGKWMLKPIAVEKRQAIHKAIEDAKLNSKQAQIDQALSLLKLAEDEARRQKARRERHAMRKVKAEEKLAAVSRPRQNSTGSSSSVYKNKAARVSVSSLASTQTSSTLARYSTNDEGIYGKQKKQKSLRHRIFGKQ